MDWTFDDTKGWLNVINIMFLKRAHFFEDIYWNIYKWKDEIFLFVYVCVFDGGWVGYEWNKIGYELVIVEAGNGHMGIHYTILGTSVYI